MNNLSEIMVKSVSEKEKLKKMYDWSKGFQKFVCCPLSAGFLQKRTLKEMEELIAHGIGKKEYLFSLFGWYSIE